MIYFDNSATTAHKPPEVAEAVAHAISAGFGGVGRGVHGASLEAGQAVFNAREKAAKLFGIKNASRVAFTNNATESLNIAISGLVEPGSHVVTTAASHNSVLRPLYRKVDKEGARLTIVPIAPDGSVDYDAFDAAFEEGTTLAVVTHASNLTGDVYDVERMAHIAHKHDAWIVVDAAQTAGLTRIKMSLESIDVLCFTGHKSLYGPQGTGGILVGDHLEIPPFKVGGSGMHSFDREHPTHMPESLEAGTLNAHGIAGLAAGLDFVNNTRVENIFDKVSRLRDRFEEGVRDIEGVTIYGGGSDKGKCGVVALNIGDMDSAEVSDILNVEYGICTRAGAHCAPLMHMAMGTEHQGAVRFSFSYFNTPEEIEEGIRAIKEIAAEYL